MRYNDAIRVIEENERRKQGEAGAQRSFMNAFFPRQAAFIRDPSRKKSGCIGRRGGKTTLVQGYAHLGVLHPEQVAKGYVRGPMRPPPLVRYWGISRDRAMELMWLPLLEFSNEWGLGAKGVAQHSTIYYPNGGQIRIVGADKAKEAEKKRGDATVLDIIDESGVFGEYLKSLLNDVVRPSHMDYLGVTCALGTPGPILKGIWYDASGPNADDFGWSAHHWDARDNPHVPHAVSEFEEVLRENKWDKDSPTFRREYLGEWVEDTGALYYKWHPDRNTYRRLPELPSGADWEYALGLDVGKDKNMALTGWAFSEHDPNLYEVYSRRGFPSSDALAAQVRALSDAWGGITYKVADCGALGSIYVEEFFDRHGIQFEAAKKTERYAFVQLLNEDFLSGRVKTIPGSTLSDEYATLPKDLEHPEDSDPRFNDHCADAGLYAWRRAKHWQHQEKGEKENVTDEEARAREAQRLEEQEVHDPGPDDEHGGQYPSWSY